MAFAKTYIQRHVLFGPQIANKPDRDLEMIIVIPCYIEPDILDTLNCINACSFPRCTVEIIVVVNSSIEANKLVIDQNIKSVDEIKQWSEQNKNPNLKVHVMHLADLPQKDAGVGFARKIGMDEAINRFEQLEKPEGIIISFDADSRCEKNYLLEIYQYFNANPKARACSIYFEHPVTGNEFSYKIYDAIVSYELYLRTYNQLLRFSGYPYAYHAVGSCFAVRAKQYAMQGGMNRKQAGEDFYFLQKIIPLGGFAEINSTCVYPSPRPSERVPFGTGPMVKKLVDTREQLQMYPLQIFYDLKILFTNADDLFVKSDAEINTTLEQLSEALKSFLIKNNFIEALAEIRNQSTNKNKFQSRFFKWFNAFRILRFANYACEKYYQKNPVSQVANHLGFASGILKNSVSDERELLILYRKYERENPMST